MKTIIVKTRKNLSSKTDSFVKKDDVLRLPSK